MNCLIRINKTREDTITLSSVGTETSQTDNHQRIKHSKHKQELKNRFKLTTHVELLTGHLQLN